MSSDTKFPRAAPPNAATTEDHPPAYDEVPSNTNVQELPPSWQLGQLPKPLQLTPDASPRYTESASGSSITHLTYSRERVKKWTTCKAYWPVWDADEAKQKLKCEDEGYLTGKVFRDLQDRHVMTVKRNKLSMWRKWTVLLPTSSSHPGQASSSHSDEQLMEVKWHWGVKPHLTGTFKNRPGNIPMVEKANGKKNAQALSGLEGEDVAIELESNSMAKLVKFTWNGVLIARMRQMSFWPSEEEKGTRSEMSLEMAIAKGVDWRIIVAMAAVLDQGVEAMQGSAYGAATAASSASSASAAAAAGA